MNRIPTPPRKILPSLGNKTANLTDHQRLNATEKLPRRRTKQRHIPRPRRLDSPPQNA